MSLSVYTTKGNLYSGISINIPMALFTELEQLVLKICFTCFLLLYALPPAWDADLMGEAVIATL